jgi:transposase
LPRIERRYPLAATLTAANRNDVTELLSLIDRVPPTGRHGKFKPKVLFADRAYDSRAHRQALRERGIAPRIGKRGAGHGSGLGKDRWVVERMFSWLHANRRLDRRYDRPTTSTKPFSPSAARSSATDSYESHPVRGPLRDVAWHAE